MIENIIYLLIALASISIIASVNDNVLLNSFLKRGVGGVTVNLGTIGVLENYTNITSFYLACSQGLLGFSGYFFIFANILLAVVWIDNLIKYKQAVV